MAVRITHPKSGQQVVVCGAELADGKICMHRPVQGRTRCKIHGGHALRGEKSNLSTNREYPKYSKDLRRDILLKYYTALESGQLLTQSNEIALYDARISVLLRQASQGKDTLEMLVALKEIRETVYSLIDGVKQSGEPEVVVDQGVLRTIGSSINQLVGELTNERKKWEEVYQVVENRRKLVESERKAIIDSQRMMTESQALVLVAALVNIIRKHVLDADTRNAISAEFVQLSSYTHSGELESQSLSASPFGV